MRNAGKYFYISLVLFGIILVTCKKDSEVEREYPRVNTFEVTDITEKGATFSGNIFYDGNQEIIDHGFVWAQYKLSLSIQNASVLSLGPGNGPIEFTANINYALAKNKEYFVAAYARTKDYTVYGKVASFKSLGSEGPIIVGFEPKNAGWRDTVIVKLKNFSKQLTSTKLHIGSTLASNFAYTDSTITTVVPPSIKSLTNLLRVEFDGNTSVFTNDTLKLIKPTIIDFSPKGGYQGDTITIYGNYLDNVRYFETNYVKLDNLFCNIVAIYKDSLRIGIPRLTKINNTFTININDFVISSPTQFTILSPRIDDFKPKVATWNDILTIYGRFNTTSPASSIRINGVNIPYVFYSKDSIKVRVPYTLNVMYSTITYATDVFTINSTQQFQLSPPTINSVTANGNISGSSITINGSCFNNGMASVSINNVAAQIYSCTSNTIVAKIPSLPNGQLTIKVTVAGQTATFNSNISLENPIITSFTPNTATFGDTIYINGDFFDKINMVKLAEQNIPLNIIYKSRNQIKVILPNNIDKNPSRIKVSIQYQDYNGNSQYSDVVSNEYFKLTAPTFSYFSPSSGTGEQEIKIVGENFNPDKNNIEVLFGDIKSVILSTSKSEINIKLDKLTKGIYPVNLRMSGFSIVSDQKFNCNSPWTKLPNLDFNISIGSFSIGDFAYLVTYDLNNYKIRKFDPASNSWSVISQLEFISYPKIAFSANDNIYLMQNTKVFCYNLSSNVWTRLNDHDGYIGRDPFALVINNKAYIGAGRDNYLVWEYNTLTDSWTQKNDIPSEMYVPNYNSTEAWQKSNFVINGKGYVTTYNNSVWEYNSAEDTWIRKNDFPGGNRYWTSSFSINNKGYIAGGTKYYYSSAILNYDEVWEYNPLNDSWIQITKIPSSNERFKSLGFYIGNKIYFGGGYCYTNYGGVNDYSFFEYNLNN